mmetsp:Transcript_29459/g.33896  ORF Transcript_29459/g.33896 Transcript_29459/m.33896 type:complete len:97 (+) Transcript_29459:49-339(+)
MTASDEEPLPPNRFELELEFLQCLASPAYLHHLATTGVLSDPKFIDFLNYLKYWKSPEYVKFVRQVSCFAPRRKKKENINRSTILFTYLTHAKRRD